MFRKDLNRPTNPLSGDTNSTISSNQIQVFSYKESTNPANDAEMESIGTIEITFPENASLVEQFPSVKVVKGQELYGEPVEKRRRIGWHSPVVKK